MRKRNSHHLSFVQRMAIGFGIIALVVGAAAGLFGMTATSADARDLAGQTVVSDGPSPTLAPDRPALGAVSLLPEHARVALHHF
jgi:hypothetical protein